MTGYVHTIQAYNFLLVLDTHTQDSIPIDVGTDVTAPPAPFREQRRGVCPRCTGLLDSAVTELQAGGSDLPLYASRGFTGFNTPATFIQFNRALRARVAVYRGDFTGALGFLDAVVLQPDRAGQPEPRGLHGLQCRPRRSGQPARHRPARPARTSGIHRSGARPSYSSRRPNHDQRFLDQANQAGAALRRPVGTFRIF